MKKLKILVVDDADFLREAMKKFLQDYNCEVITSSNGLEGIRDTVAHKPDIIFLDLMMPSFNGIDMLKAVRAIPEFKEIPVVIITAITKGKAIEEVHKIGVPYIIFKPLTKKTIVDTINKIFGVATISKPHDTSDAEKNAQKPKEAPDHEEEIRIRRHLFRLFVKSIDKRISEINSAIQARNEVVIKSILHDLKGAGSSIGYPRLTLLSTHAENNILVGKMDTFRWDEVVRNSKKILELLDHIKYLPDPDMENRAETFDENSSVND